MTEPVNADPEHGRWYDLRPQVRNLTILLGVMVVVLVLDAFFRWARASWVAGILDGSVVYTDAAADSVDGRVVAVTIVYLLMVVTVGIVFMVWQFRYAKNSRMLGPDSWAPGWAIGGWFIPIANLVIPPLHIIRASRTNPPAWRSGDRLPGTATLVWCWAALLYVGGAIGRAAERGGPDPDSFEYADWVISSDRTGAVASIILVAAAAAAVVMTSTLTRRQESARTSKASPPPGEDPPALIR